MVTFLRTLFFFLVFWTHQLLILPFLVYYSIRADRTGDPGVRPPVCRIAHGWGRLICRLGGARVTVNDHAGLAPDEAVLFVSNHQSDFDIPVLLAFGGRDLAFVAKKELENIPLVSPWMKLMGCIFLDRENRRKQVAQIKQTVEHLQSGLSMVVFPEGTRSRSPEMRPFAKGSLNIAERAGVRIVPITLRDTYALNPKGVFGFPGGDVTLTLHPALDPTTLSKDEKSDLHNAVQAVVASALHPASTIEDAHA